MYRVDILAHAIAIRLQFYPNLDLGFHIQKFIGLFIIIWTNSSHYMDDCFIPIVMICTRLCHMSHPSRFCDTFSTHIG